MTAITVTQRTTRRKKNPFIFPTTHLEMHRDQSKKIPENSLEQPKAEFDFKLTESLFKMISANSPPIIDHHRCEVINLSQAIGLCG